MPQVVNVVKDSGGRIIRTERTFVSPSSNESVTKKSQGTETGHYAGGSDSNKTVNQAQMVSDIKAGKIPKIGESQAQFESRTGKTLSKDTKDAIFIGGHTYLPTKMGGVQYTPEIAKQIWETKMARGEPIVFYNSPLAQWSAKAESMISQFESQTGNKLSGSREEKVNQIISIQQGGNKIGKSIEFGGTTLPTKINGVQYTPEIAKQIWETKMARGEPIVNYRGSLAVGQYWGKILDEQKKNEDDSSKILGSGSFGYEEGTVSPILRSGLPKVTGESFTDWYMKNVKDVESTQTAVGLTMLVTPLKAFGVAGFSWATFGKIAPVEAGFGFSKLITAGATKGIGKLVPEQDSGFSTSGFVAQVERGLLFAGSSHIPSVGWAYGGEIVKNLVASPKETSKDIMNYALKNPYEVGTMLLAGGIRIKPEESGVKSFAGLEKVWDVSYKFPKLLTNVYTKIYDRGFKPVVKNPLGEQFIQGVTIPKVNDLINEGTGGRSSHSVIVDNVISNPVVNQKPMVVDVGLIPKRGAVLDVNPSRVEYGDVLYSINELTDLKPFGGKFGKTVLDVGRSEGGVLVGSGGAYQVFKKARTPNDFDIVVSDQLKFIKSLEKSYGEKLGVNDRYINGHRVVKVSELNGGGSVNLVLKEAYRSSAKWFGLGELKIVEVEGIKILSPKELLKHKVEVFKSYGSDVKVGKLRNKIFGSDFVREKIGKTALDIKSYTGGKLVLDLDKTTLTGAYGFTKAELESYVGKTGIVAHSSTGLFSLFKNEVPLKQAKESAGYEIGLFGTPWDIKTGMPQTRITRLGGEASFFDILKGDYQTVKEASNPQIVLFPEQKIGLNTGKNPLGETFNVIEKSSELEVGLPIRNLKGKFNVVRKTADLGTTIVGGGLFGGSRVKIVSAEIVKADKLLSESSLRNIEKVKFGIAKPEDISSLKASLFKETGIQYSEPMKPYWNPERTLRKDVLFRSSEKVSYEEFRSYGAVGGVSSKELSYSELVSYAGSYSVPSMPSISSEGVVSYGGGYSISSASLSYPSVPSMPSVSVPSYPSRPSRPSSPDLSIPNFPPFKYFDEGEKFVNVKVRRRHRQDLYYVPDFTSLQLGLSFKEPKGFLKSLRTKTFTGFEMRGILR